MKPLASKHLTRQRGSGFTLVELLVAMAVFAVMSAMAYGGLTSVLEASTSVDRALVQTADIQGAIHRVQADLEQVVNRPVRDEFGDLQPAVGTPPERNGIELTRNGWRNPLSEPRSHLQRVAYRVDEESQLVRLHWRVLDRAQDSLPIETVLLEDVDNVEWRFLNEEREWVDIWPPPDAAAPASAPAPTPGAAASAAGPPMPRAVELRLESAAWGDIRYLFAITGSQT